MDSKETKTDKAKILDGVIVSTKMKDTALVLTQRYVKNPKYGKYQKIGKKYQAHDPGNLHEVGEKVRIQSCRPISKNKHFKIVKEA